jgi:putative inorganic carbon (HCO3(-)) transporter
MIRSRSVSFSGEYLAIPVIGGIVIALTTAFILRLSYLWSALIITGLTVAVGSLIARNFKSYWLAIFALTLPLEIKKMLVDSGYVQQLVLRYGFPIGELPGPVLYLSDLPFIVLLVCWAYDLIIRKEKIYFPRSNWLALAFITWSGLSVIKAPHFSLAVFELIRMIKLYLLYLYAANNLRSRETIKVLINFFLLGVIVQGMLCLAQYLTKDPGILLNKLLGNSGIMTSEFAKKLDPFFSISESGGAGIRASGTAGAGNAEALYFEYLIPIAFTLFLATRRFRDRVLETAAWALGLSGLVVTFSRGGLIGIAAGLLTAILLAKRYNLISVGSFHFFILSGVVICILAFPIIYDYLMTRPEATTARLHLNKVGLAMIKDHPILGVGLNNHLIVKPEYDPRTYIFQMPTHNHYLLIASQTGIPGLLFFLGFVFVTFQMAVRAAKSRDSYIIALSVGIIAGLVSVLVHIQVDYLGTYTTVSLFWLFCGLTAAFSYGNYEGIHTATAMQRINYPQVNSLS